jgi:hypothetical protein
MMYNNKLVASLKANGKILREFKDTVYIPFGSEYSFLIKNLHTTRALINIFIDGDNVVPGGLVLDAGKEIDLERYVRNGNLTEGNRFKFIERTAGIEQHRGVKLEDGLVRIEFQFEAAVQVRTPVVWTTTNLVQDHYYNGLKVGTSSNPLRNGWLTASGATFGGAGGGTNTHGVYNVGGIARSADMSKGQFTGEVATAAVNQYLKDNNIKPTSSDICYDSCATMDLHNDAGITVSGSKSTQSFSTTYMGAMDPEKHSIVLKLLGETPDNRPVLKPVTVRAKPKCTTCGRQNKAHAKFCVECGTALEIFA